LISALMVMPMASSFQSGERKRTTGVAKTRIGDFGGGQMWVLLWGL
jgi:hypothetical protein